MQKIRQMELEDFVTQIAEMEPAYAIKYLSETLINLFMLKERDFFLKFQETEQDSLDLKCYHRSGRDTTETFKICFLI